MVRAVLKYLEIQHKLQPATLSRFEKTYLSSNNSMLSTNTCAVVAQNKSNQCMHGLLPFACGLLSVFAAPVVGDVSKSAVPLEAIPGKEAIEPVVS